MIPIILILFFLILPFVLNLLYKQCDVYKNLFVDINKFQELKENDRFDVVNLGSNQPKFAFEYSDTSVKGMNWAIGPQTFEYDLAVLMKYSKHLNPNARVIIPVCPLSFFKIETEPNNRVKYYALFDSHEMPDYDIKQKLKEYIFPVLFNPKRIMNIFYDVKKDTRLMLEVNPMNHEQVLKDATYWIEECWNPEFKINISNMLPLSDINKKSVEINIRVLSDIIRYCLDNSFKPFIVILPVTKCLSSKFSEDFIYNHIVKYINLANVYDVPVLNYLYDERFVTSDLYINSFFMNKSGRRIFTKDFLDKLNI